MSVSELKERHVAATETVNSLGERLKQKRLLLLDTDSNYYFNFLSFLFSSKERYKKSVVLEMDLIEVVMVCCSCGTCEGAREESGEFWAHRSGLLQDSSRTHWQGNNHFFFI
jgi:hypothetical protein